MLAVPFAVVALLVHPYAPTLLPGRLRLLVEALLVATGLLALAWRLVLGKAYATTGDLGPTQVPGLAYPVAVALLDLDGFKALLGHAPSLSVDVSAVQLADDGLVADVLAALATSLVVEITETTLVQDPVVARARLSALGPSGCGSRWTTSAPSAACRRCPWTSSRSVTDLPLGAREASVATAVLTLASSLGLSVVAEGVELEAQADRLHALGCRLGQGFRRSRAVPGGPGVAGGRAGRRRPRAAALRTEGRGCAVVGGWTTTPAPPSCST